MVSLQYSIEEAVPTHPYSAPGATARYRHGEGRALLAFVLGRPEGDSIVDALRNALGYPGAFLRQA
eukprot:8118792-Alexandrium_andersonii.AAC.1